MMRARYLALMAVAIAPALFAAYTYYFTDSLTSINTSNWTENGTLTAGSGGLTSSNSNGGSLIYKLAAPDGSSNYEVKTTLTLTASGGTYVTYLRGSSNALSGPAPAGTTYAFEVQNPTFSGSACTATLAGYKIVSAAVTSLGSTTIPCHNGVAVRAIYTAISNLIAVYVDNILYFMIQDSTITSGQPGVGVRGAPAGNSIAQVKLGGIYVGTPTMPPTDEIGVSAFANRVDFQWPGASEASGPGIAYYAVWRSGVQLTTLYDEAFSDNTVTTPSNYQYTLIAYDFDLNYSTTSFIVVMPPAGAIDPREVGVRPTGSYWGGGGEQIDMRSGNLNYTMPILKAMGRGGWGVGFNLTYNSQNWRQDPGGTWQLGEDVGYGYGWKLLAGSLLPVIGPTGLVFEYLFTDATGAQYDLNQNSSGVWSSLESVYVSYDSNAAKLHFNNGSYWVMGCVSAGTEWDAGTLYPTLMEDSNGNEIFINYNDGVGVTWTNSSSRISSIEDVRGYGSADYVFAYNSDAIPHLTTITNYIGTSEHYRFAYNENYALDSPFNGANFSTVALLESSTVTGIPLTTYFSYDTTSATSSCSSPGTGASGPGQLTQVTTPYCGHLRWTYTPANTLSGSRTYNEVQNRFLSVSSGAAETEIQLIRGTDTSYTLHSSALLKDSPANAEKYWTFKPDTTQFNGGLQLSYQECQLPGTDCNAGQANVLSHLDFTWAQTPTTLNPYIGTTVTKLNPGQTYEQDKQTIQALDQYGNLLTMQAYNFGNGSPGALARTYTNTYLGGTNYTSRYIFNRLLTSTVTDGTNTATLASNTYDQSALTNIPNPCGSIQGDLCEHDNTNYPYTFTYRGNVSSSTTPTTIATYSLDLTGSVTSTQVNGITTNVTAANNYAAPGQITTGTLTSTMNWNTFLGLSSATGPNGDSGSIGYDANARPASTTSPYGAVTNYTYNDTASPPNKIVMTGTQGAETVMDGFGRTIQTIAGYGTSTPSTVVSTVDVQYAPCGCSPLGKLSQQSQPYAPGGSDAWTVYHYDASGRTTSVVLPDGSTTSYSYAGSWVTVVDPASHTKSFAMDAFGNLIEVGETDPSLGLVYTTYGYDVLNHLIAVSMTRGSNTQTRTFNYNSGTTVTGFLQSATNPENGTVTYTYNSATNTLASKTDALNNKFTYQYDTYNRLGSVSLAVPYNCPPPPQSCNPPPPQVLRTYYYDTNPLDSTGKFSQNPFGRLTAVQYPAIGTSSTVQLNDMYSYTPAGLTATKRLQVNEPVTYLDQNNNRHNTIITANLDTGFTYNGLSAIASMSYPATGLSLWPVAGASYNYSFDSMNRLSGMKTSGGATIVNNVSYNAANQLLTMNYDALAETRSYNVLNQLTNITAGTSENLTYNYPTGTNNGKVSSMYNAVSGETITYTYDSLNRLLTANGSGWGEQYGFDGFGNLLSKTVTAGSGPSLSQAVNPANNQIVGLSYDADGNASTVNNNGLSYNVGYDAENRLSSIVQGSNNTELASYFYDAQNKRIFSGPAGADSYGNLTNYTVYVYSPSGQRLGGYLLATAFVDNSQTNYVVTPALQVTGTSGDAYFGGRRLAVMDQLGSAGTYYPWGEAKGGTNPQDTWNFGTYWQDSVSGLDYANNRYYSNAYGRFMTTDPYKAHGGGPGNPRDPQSWNRYTYTSGDPVNRLDPTGLLWEDVCDFDGNDASCGGGGGDDGGGQDGGGGGSSDPLTCWLAGAVTSSASLHVFTGNTGASGGPSAGFYWGDSIQLYFEASGGNGNYAFSAWQYIQVVGTATYTNGTTTQTYDVTTPWQLDAQYPGTVTQDGSLMTYRDAPGARLNTSSTQPGGFQTLVSASLTWYATTIAWVTSGGVTVSCGNVYWTATVNATNTAPGYWQLSGESSVTSYSP